MDPGLLSGSDTDCLSVFYKAHGIGLGIFQGDHGNCQIDLCLLGQFFILCHDIGEEFIVDLQLISSLFKGNAKHILVLQLCRLIGRIDLYHVIISFFLLLQDFQSLRLISRSNHAVGHLALNKPCRIHITDVGQRNKVSKGRHPVCSSGSCIGTGQRGKLSKVVHPVDFRQRLGKRKPYRSTCRRYMLEGCSCRKSGGFLQLADQLPAIEGIQEINVSRPSVQYLDRQFASVCHIDPGRLLIRVTSIF